MTKNEFVDQVAANSGLGKGEATKAVSYTHLTLPTNREV